MPDDRWSYARVGPLLSGVALLLAGIVLPWIRPDPDAAGSGDGYPDIYVPGMRAGLEAIDVLVVLPVVLAVGLLALGNRPRLRGLGTVAAGAMTLFVTGRYVAARPLVGFGETFVPAAGWYLTVLGGSLVIVAGLADRFWSAPVAPPDDPDEQHPS